MKLVVDTTFVSTCRGNGQPRGFCASQAIREAERAKFSRYPELGGQRRCKLLPVVLEAHGRWSHAAASFVHSLAKWKAQSVPRLLRRISEHLWFSGWPALLSCAAQQAYAASLLEQPLGQEARVTGITPTTSELECVPTKRSSTSAG